MSNSIYIFADTCFRMIYSAYNKYDEVNLCKLRDEVKSMQIESRFGHKMDARLVTSSSCTSANVHQHSFSFLHTH